MARVAILFTGGTISMVGSVGGSVPTLRGADLIASVPGLDALADIEPIEWGMVPASHLTFEQVLDIGRRLYATLSRADVDGAVVVQGTDVIEETAYAWDLLPMPDKPVIVTGAMRSASQDGYDGPENLRNAVVAASDPALAGQGVLVALDGELHAADDVRKTHTHAYSTFQSPNLGRVGTVSGRGVALERPRTPTRLPAIPARAALPVPILTVVLDEKPSLATLDPAGLVVAAAGGGNTPPAFLELARRLIPHGVPVVLTTRCPSGRPLPGYGFEGGSSQWHAAGATFSGTLGALKARVAVALGVGAGLSGGDFDALFGPSGGGRGLGTPDSAGRMT